MKIKHCLITLLGVLMACVCMTLAGAGYADSNLSITSPSNGKTYTTDSSITIKWNKITGAAGYHVSVRNTDTDELVLERKWTTSTSMKISSYIEAPGTYKVWVGAVETKGAASIQEWQDYIYIYVSLSAPDITYPSDNSTCTAGESIKLQWDSVTGADGYKYYIKQLSGSPDRSNNNEPYINQWNGSTSSSRRYYTLSASNVKAGYWYKFVVEAYADGYDSGWSDWCYVYVEKKTLDKPVISYPVSDNTYTANQSIKLQWSTVSDADGYTYYIKQLAGEPDYVSENEASIAEWSKSTTSTYYTLPASDVKGGYWYKFVVEAYASDAKSGWSNWCYVYINPLAPITLDKPVITSPSASQTYPANQSIKLKWDSVAGAEGYQYYIKQLLGDPDPSNNDETAVESWSDTTNGYSYTLDASNVKGGYWYKFVVRAYANGAESWSEWRYVYVPLDKAVITTPSNWTEVNAGSSITVKWNTVPGADEYKSHIIRLKGEPNTSNDKEQTLPLNGDTGEWRVDRGTSLSYTLSASNVIGGYWYKIVIEAKNTVRNLSSWSEWYYVYANEKGTLGRPEITSPVAHQNYEYGEAISLTWSAVGNATGYKYYIKQLAGEPDNSDNELAINSWTGETSKNNRRYTLSGKYVQPNTWYKFVVEAKADGYYSGWSRYTYIKIPDRVDWIHYILPSAITDINVEAFSGNKLLRTFDASNSELTTIGSKAFANCTNLVSINLPITVESIADDAFVNCPNLTIHCISGSNAETYANKKNIPVEIHGIALDTDTVQLSQSNWDVLYAEKAEATVRVISSGNWSASSDRSWLKFNKASGDNGSNIVLSVTENATGSKRDGTITFTCGDAKAYVKVTQNYVYASAGTNTTKPNPIVTGSWNDTDIITVTLGQSYQLSGYISVQNGYLGNVSVSVHGGADRALNHDYAGTVSTINLADELYFNIDTSTNTSFNKADTYKLVMYAKAYGSSDAVRIGEKTLVVEEPIAIQKPVISFTRTPATVLNNGSGKFNLTVTTTYADMFYVELLKDGSPVNIYDDYVQTVQKREYKETDFRNVATLYTTSSKRWPTLSAITIPSGTAEGTYTIQVTAVNNQGKSSSATASLEVVSKIPMQSVTITNSKPINLIIADTSIELTDTLIATYSPTNATEKTLIWSSSDNSVVRVEGNGNSAKITALKEGNAKITVYNSVNNIIQDSVDVYVRKVFGGTYRVLRTFVVDGKEYRQAELLQDYKGVKALQNDGNYTIFYIDTKGHVVTDKEVLVKLFTMQIFIDESWEKDEDRSRFIDWTNILKTNADVAQEFLTSKEISDAVGQAAGIAMSFLLNNPLKIPSAIANVAERAMSIVVVTFQNEMINGLSRTAIEINNCLLEQEEKIRKGTVYYYDDIYRLLDYYVYCKACVQQSNNTSRAIIDGFMKQYRDNWGMAASKLKSIADGMIKNISVWSESTDYTLKSASTLYKYVCDFLDGKVKDDWFIDQALKNGASLIGDKTKAFVDIYTNLKKYYKKMIEAMPDSTELDYSCLKGYSLYCSTKGVYPTNMEDLTKTTDVEQSGFYKILIELSK